jgi:ABC-2 type transport system permease protein
MAIREQRRSLIGWSIGIAALVLLMAAVWPTVRDMPGLKDFIRHYPPALKKVFKLEERFATGGGYLNSELFSLMVPAMFLVFGIGHGARLVAGEEEDGTLEVLLTVAPSRRRVILEKAAALVATVALLGLALLVSTLLADVAISMKVGLADLVRGSATLTALALEYALLAFAVGAASGRRGIAIAVATGTAVATYVLFVLGQLLDSVRPWQGISSFTQALGHGPIGPTWSPGVLTMLAVGIVAVAVGTMVFDRRDLRR